MTSDYLLIERPGVGEDVQIHYKKRSDGWYVQTPENDEYWKFADMTASEHTVRVLIFKKWCRRWSADPDPLDDRN